MISTGCCQGFFRSHRWATESPRFVQAFHHHHTRAQAEVQISQLHNVCWVFRETTPFLAWEGLVRELEHISAVRGVGGIRVDQVGYRLD